jgi:uncharacterized protein YbjT (DUF2867 family)
MSGEQVHAFVTGATGYTGRELVQVLRDSGREVVAHVRPASRELASARSRFEAMGARVDTTPWEEAAMTETLRALAPKAVFALLGTTRARAKKARAEGRDAQSESYEAVDYGLTALLLRAAKASGAAPRFVYLSAMGVSERSSNAYIAVRGRMERELHASGVEHAIARPSFITGPDREESRPAERAFAAVADGLLGVMGALGATRLRDRYQAMDGRTLARALASIAFDPAAANGLFEADALRARGLPR